MLESLIAMSGQMTMPQARPLSDSDLERLRRVVIGYDAYEDRHHTSDFMGRIYTVVRKLMREADKDRHPLANRTITVSGLLGYIFGMPLTFGECDDKLIVVLEVQDGSTYTDTLFD